MLGSEVAHLRQCIADEYRAARLGLSGLACGSSRHDFIESHMDHMGQYQEQLVTLVGQDQAIVLVVETLNAQPAAPTPGSREEGGNHS